MKKTCFFLTLAFSFQSSSAGVFLKSEKYFKDQIVIEFVNAIQSGRVEKIKTLLKQGVSANAEGLEGLRPIHFVQPSTENLKVLEVLLAAGADPNAKGGVGNTILHYAVQHSSVPFVEMLLKNKANPNAEGENGIPVLYLAMSSEVPSEMVKVLLTAGADPNKVYGGYPPLQSAMVTQSWGAAVALLEGGADPNVKTKQGETAVEFFCQLLKKMKPKSKATSKIIETANLLEKKGFDVSCMDRKIWRI